MLIARTLLFLFIASSSLLLVFDVQAETTDPGIELGDEYGSHSKSKGASSSSSSEPLWQSILLYPVNRVMDLVDIFRVDVGVGPSYGWVVRATKYGQVGYRQFTPGSVRLGLRGREIPVWAETDSEFGIGPTFAQSRDREVTPAEVGVGADLFIVGGYVGASLDEALDFLLGWVLVDFKNDDY